MNSEAHQASPKKRCRAGDLAWIVLYAGLGIFLMFALMLLLDTWHTSTLSWQFLGR